MSATSSGVNDCGLPMLRWTAVSLARRTIAGAGNPTSSSAPTPWWICARAARSTPGSTTSRSEPLTASASLTKRRSDLCAASSVRRNSSWTQAMALRSSPPGTGAAAEGSSSVLSIRRLKDVSWAMRPAST